MREHNVQYYKGQMFIQQGINPVTHQIIQQTPSSPANQYPTNAQFVGGVNNPYSAIPQHHLIQVYAQNHQQAPLFGNSFGTNQFQTSTRVLGANNVAQPAYGGVNPNIGIQPQHSQQVHAQSGYSQASGLNNALGANQHATNFKGTLGANKAPQQTLQVSFQNPKQTIRPQQTTQKPAELKKQVVANHHPANTQGGSNLNRPSAKIQQQFSGQNPTGNNPLPTIPQYPAHLPPVQYTLGQHLINSK